MEDRTCTIEICNLTRNYYISYGAMRSRQDWKTMKGAVKAATRKGYTVLNPNVDPMVEFRANDKKTKIVKSLMSDKLVRIAVNTPACCDPSTETYWCM